MSEQTSQKEEILDLGGLSDDQIATLSSDEVDKYLKAAQAGLAEAGESANDEPEPDTDQDGSQSAAADGEQDNEPDVTGGADSDFQSLNPYGDEAGTGRIEQSAHEGNEEAADQSSEDDQSSQADGEAESSEGKDWKARYEALQAEYDSVMGSFKASGRTVKVESPDDARRLMQMGYDYTNKMRELKPRLRAIRALEHNGLLDDEKFNFMIDLMKGNPEAVKKFLKDSDIDPIELDLEGSTVYKPTDHRPSEEQLALDEVLDSIRDSETFPRTAHVITKEWDKASQQVLMGMPQLISVINSHMEFGYFDQIAAKVQYERSLGRLAGLSDLDAYKAIGDAMQREGAFAPARRGTTPKAETGQGHSQDSKGSTNGGEVDHRKRAASPTKGGASAGNATQKNYLSDFSDEEIEKMGRQAL
jgi:hypothetical protein